MKGTEWTEREMCAADRVCMGYKQAKELECGLTTSNLLSAAGEDRVQGSGNPGSRGLM